MTKAKKKRSKQELASLAISRVLDPIVLIPMLLILAVSWALVNGERMMFLAFLLMVDGILPGFVLVWFIARGNILSGWDVREREERIPLFLFVTLAHATGVVAAWFLDKQPLAQYLTAFWLLTVVYAVVTLYWKISVHVGVVSALATFVTLVFGWQWAWLYGLVALVGWARVAGKFHRIRQAWVGGLVPVVVIPLVFWWFGLLPDFL